MIIVDVLFIILLFSGFAFSHTWLASLKVKKSLAEKLENIILFYRLFYNISSLILFAFFYFLSPKPDVIIYDLHYPFDIITFALQVLSFIGLIWAAMPTNLQEFVGVAQIKRYLRGDYKKNELDERSTLRIVGAYKIVRHPVYFFSILFLGFRPTMDLFYFVMFLCIVVYFYIGSIYEEKKLVELFGDDYLKYQKRVARIIPGIKFL
jgi:protein-S-isoprenylcysteine O-methyltransferase Ste14